MQMFGPKNMMRMAMMMLCGAALAIPAMAQDTPPNPPAQAQQQGPPQGGGGGGMRGMDPERRAAMLKQRLNLSDDQTTQIKAIYTADATKMQALRDDTSGDRREKMMALMQDEDTKIKALLTDDQKKQYDEIQAQRRARMGGGGGGSQ